MSQRRSPRRWVWDDDQPVPLSLPFANPLLGAEVLVPTRIWLESGDAGPGRICWRPDRDGEARAPVRWLTAFTRLADADDDTILAFAQEHGVLGICRHGRVANHPGGHRGDGRCEFLGSGERAWEDASRRQDWLLAAGMDEEPGGTVEQRRIQILRRGGAYWEPVAAWRCYARGLRALLNMAKDLQDGKRVGQADWRDAVAACRDPSAGSMDSIVDPSWWERPTTSFDLRSLALNASLDEQHRRFLQLVGFYLRDARIRPELSWQPSPDNETKGRFVPGFAVEGLPAEGLYGGGGGRGLDDHSPFWKGQSLYAVLVLELVAAIGNPRGLFRCSVCGELYALADGQRTPRYDRGNRCSEECVRQAELATKRRSHHKRKDARAEQAASGE